MSATGAGYDLSTTIFSPDGRVYQVEYAGKAVEKSGTVIGIRCKDGVVLAVDKSITNKMVVRKANRRIFTVDEHAGMVSAGLVADGRHLANQARSEAVNYKGFYGTPIPGSILNDRLAGFVHTYTLYWYLRPFGISTLLATYGKEGPQLYQIDPSGQSNRYFATASGMHKRGAKTELEKLKLEDMTCRQAVKEAARILVKLHDDIKEKDYEIELSWVCDESNKKHVHVPENLAQEAFKVAVDLKREDEMEADDKPAS